MDQPSIELLVRAACDSGSGSESESVPTPTPLPSGHARSRSNSTSKSADMSPTPPLESRSHAGGRGQAKRGHSLSLAKLAASRHRSGFAQQFFQDLIAGRVEPYREDGPHHVSVLQDARVATASRNGLLSSASWRPKHQLRNGWYLVDPPNSSHGLAQQSLEGLAECSWSGQSGREKRDEQINALLVRDIGVVTTPSQMGYSKRAKIYTYDPLGDSLTSTDRLYAGVKLLCVHDKRRYTKKSDNSPCAVRVVSHGIVRTPELHRTPPHTVKSLTSSPAPARSSSHSPRGSRPRKELSAMADQTSATPNPSSSMPMTIESELGQMLTALASPRGRMNENSSALDDLGSVSMQVGLEQKRRRTGAASPLAALSASQLLSYEQGPEQQVSLSL